MDRRHFLALLSTPVLVALLESCSSDDAGTDPTGGTDTTGGTGSTPGTSAPGTWEPGTSEPDATAPGTTGQGGAGAAETRSELARTTVPAAEGRAASDAFNQLGRDLLRELSTAQPSGNLVFSPASIALALTMTAAGARGQTLEQILATLHVDDADGIHRATNAVTAELERRNEGSVELSVSNSLWAQNGLSFEPTFLDLLATEYGAGVNLVDYRTDPEAARAAINAWVADETSDRIPQLLAEGVITADARLTLVNAIYMKAPWLRQFSEDATSEITFTNVDGDATTVAAMSMSRSFLYASGEGWQSVELDYEGEQMAMALLVPDAGKLGEYEQGAALAGLTEAAAYRSVRLTLPKFDIESSLSLDDVLQALGMTTAFTRDADFSGITTQETLNVGAVIHQANISVDEFGTEAAAATAVVIETTSAPGDEPVELVIDRPFLFSVFDRETGVVLFAGRVGDPAA